MDKKYLAAISGGPDSMALLDMYKNYIKVAIHVNYKKRDNSDVDMNIVKKYCKKNNIIFECLNVTKEMYSLADSNNFQHTARTIRYDFFKKTADRYQMFNLLVAHQLDDFLETAKMQKNKKSLNFFYGIRKHSNYQNVLIYRPLLKYSKNYLVKYCQKNNISYAIDNTNQQPIYERNRVRLSNQNKNIFIKKLTKLNIDFKNWINHCKEKKLNKIFLQWEKQEFSIDYFRKTSNRHQSHLIYIYLKKLNIDINHNKIKGIIDFVLSSKGNVAFRLKADVKLLKQNNKLEIKR